MKPFTVAKDLLRWLAVANVGERVMYRGTIYYVVPYWKTDGSRGKTIGQELRVKAAGARPADHALRIIQGPTGEELRSGPRGY